MGKHTDIWDMTPEEKKEWERTHDIRSMVISMNNAKQEEAEERQQGTLGSEE